MVKFKLVNGGKKQKVRYSDKEIGLFSALPQGNGGSKTSLELIEDIGDTTFYARQNLNSTLGHLARKINVNNEPFAICRSMRSGPYPINWWVEKKKAASG